MSTGDARPRFLTRHDTTMLLEALAQAVTEADGQATASGVSGALVAAMEAAGIHPALVHAFRVTGMLVSEDNQDLWTRAELDRWSAAVAAYRPGVRVDEPAPASGRAAAFLASSPSTAC
jgi:hypothetical protein